MCPWYAHRVRVVVALLFATVAAAQISPPFPNAGPPLILRLDGILQPTREAVQGIGFTTVSLRILGDEGGDRFVDVEDARTIGGDNPVNGKDVLAAVAGFQPNLLATGPETLLRPLRQLAPGTRVRLEGLVERGSRTYYLREVLKKAAD